jgi:hypothetical protein
MKKQLLVSIALFSGVVFFNACKKQDPTPPTIIINTIPVNLDAALANKESYTLDLSQYGDADDVSTIVQQATNYTTSQIDVTSTTDKRGTYTYMYDASNLTSGKIINPLVKDSVVLKIEEGEKTQTNCHGGGKGPKHGGQKPPKFGFHLFHKDHPDASKTIIEDVYLIKIVFTINTATTVPIVLTTKMSNVKY